MRRRQLPRRTQRGFALMAMLALLVAGVLYFAVTALSPQVLDAYRARKTEAALAQAREALLGYAIQHRDRQMAQDPPKFEMYGYLPLPDVGSARNNNNDPGCHLNNNPALAPLEGCDAARFTGTFFDANGMSPTVAGRLPWRTLGIEPIRDGYGECLWLIVSSSHGRIFRSSPAPTPPAINWDKLGQLDVVVADGAANLKSVLATAHDRPVAIIFSPGPPLPGQDRSATGADDVTQCGGNYNPANYLDPGVAAVIPATSNYFAGTTATDTGTKDLAISMQGNIAKDNDGKLWPRNCPANDNCARVANDRGLAVTPDELFDSLRKNAGFRAEINDMLTKMTNCWSLNAASLTPLPVTFSGDSPGDKEAGRIPDAPVSCADRIDTAYGDSYDPKGYFSNYREMIFVARPTSGTFTVNGDATCKGVLIFSGQRGANQTRATDDEKKRPSNYLESSVLDSFQGAGKTFSGPAEFDTLASGQTGQQDIVRCIPDPAKLTPTLVTSPALTARGYNQLVSYDPTSRTLTLGAENVTTTKGAPGAALFGCAWMPEMGTRGKGFRAYFSVRFMGVTGGVGNNGFVFAAVDGENNTTEACGAAGASLGYSGDNGVTPPLTFPKIGIEFDQAFNSGRNDPARSYDCSGTSHSYSYNSHSAIVYWGNDGVANDDNIHGAPTSAATTRPAPQNPADLCATPPGIGFVNYRAREDVNGDGTLDSYLYHVRVEVTPTRNVDASAAESSSTTFATQAWIIRDSTTNAQITATMQNLSRPMAQLSPATAPTLGDTATVYDVAGSACGSGCPSGQTCGTDNVCYRQGLKSVRLGFTGSQRTQDQQVIIGNFMASWLQ